MWNSSAKDQVETQGSFSNPDVVSGNGEDGKKPEPELRAPSFIAKIQQDYPVK